MSQLLVKFVNYVEEMRTNQKAFFRLQAMAKKNPLLHADRKHALETSKRYEIDVDHMLEQVKKEVQNG